MLLDASGAFEVANTGLFASRVIRSDPVFEAVYAFRIFSFSWFHHMSPRFTEVTWGLGKIRAPRGNGEMSRWRANEQMLLGKQQISDRLQNYAKLFDLSSGDIIFKLWWFTCCQCCLQWVSVKWYLFSLSCHGFNGFAMSVLSLLEPFNCKLHGGHLAFWHILTRLNCSQLTSKWCNLHQLTLVSHQNQSKSSQFWANTRRCHGHKTLAQICGKKHLMGSVDW